MKPLLLEMSAFGAFAQKQVIDFTELGNRDFFLIHGATGAGKTTILDAICFALYGDSSGAERNPEQMRSDYASPEEPTRVAFTFALAGRKYLVTRSPRQPRPAKRGSGLTMEMPRAEFYVLEGAEWQPLASGWSRVTEVVEETLGFKSGQFRQVVLLPQGQFRRLLTADSRERQAILEVLFRTGRFSSIEAYFKEEASTLRLYLEQLQQQKETLLGMADCSSLEELRAKIVSTEVLLQEMAVTAAEKESANFQARRRLAEGYRIKAIFDEMDQACAAYAALQEQQAAMEKERQMLEHARQALGLLPAEERLQALRRIARQAEEEKNAANAELEKVQKLHREAENTWKQEEGREREREQAARQVAYLSDLLNRVVEIQAAHSDWEKALAVEREVKQVHQEIDAAWQQAQKARYSIREQEERAAETARQLPALEKEREEKERLHRRRIELSEQEKKLLLAQKRVDASQKLLEEAEKRYRYVKKTSQQLQELWKNAQAALLAATLQEGSACPVCGSLHHPCLARYDQTIPSAEELDQSGQDLERTQAAWQNAQKQLLTCQSIRQDLENRIKLLREDLGEEARRSSQELQGELNELDKRRQAAKQAAEEQAKLARQMQEIEKQEAQLEEKLKRVQQEYSQAVQRSAGLQAVYEERVRQVPAEMLDETRLRGACKQAEEQLRMLKQALEKARLQLQGVGERMAAAGDRAQRAELHFSEARKDLVEEEKDFAGRLLASIFANEEEYRSARRSEEEMRQLESRLREYDTAFGAAEERVRRSKQQATGLEAPVLEELEKDARAKEEELKSLNNEISLLSAKVERERQLGQKLDLLVQKLAEEEEQYQIIGRLAEVANGRNPLGITFQRFVLGALLEDVIIAASERLKIMSRGRFILQRTLERSRANAAGGLDMEVFDNYTGTARPVTSLSGGESFLASLSLALGLAEVVQSYAGGIRLDTLFIDEGFGSLDADSLDHALRVLIDLQREGRLVGIISHIEELKERIDTRLEVTKTNRGSNAAFRIS